MRGKLGRGHRRIEQKKKDEGCLCGLHRFLTEKDEETRSGVNRGRSSNGKRHTPLTRISVVLFVEM